MHQYLEKILSEQNKIVKQLKKNLTGKDYIQKIYDGTIKKEQKKSLKEQLSQSGLNIIAEIKRKSPSQGSFDSIINPSVLARSYADGGAAAISVLTNEYGFNGSIEDLVQVAETLAMNHCAILRKEFILDEIQVAESIAIGANAALLIVCVLKEKTEDLLKECQRLGIEALVEVHDKQELLYAIDIGATLIAINNRNLHTFSVYPDRALSLKKYIPKEIITVAASGIASVEDIRIYQQENFNGLLIGEALVKSTDPASMIKAMRSA